MAQTKREIAAVLAAAGTQPKHRFGQNFMIDQNLVRLVAEAGRVAPGDHVIEVGPGTGTLTEELLARGAHVIAVEIDRDLAAALRTRFAGEPKLELIEGDALANKHTINAALLARIGQSRQADPPAVVKLVANLPYNIASPLVIELLSVHVELLAFTVQKEVADRLSARAGDDAYGPLSVVAQLLGDVEVVRTLPPQAFWPPPKIDSSLVRIVRRSHAHPAAAELSTFVHGVFSYRRKTLRKALAEAAHDSPAVLAATGLDGQLRPEQFTPDDFAALFAAASRLRR